MTNPVCRGSFATMFSLRSSRLVPFVVLSALLTGCGGGGQDATPVPAGRYVGSWTTELPGDAAGTADITIAADRTISGSLNADYGPHYGPGGQAYGKIRTSGDTDVVGLWYAQGEQVPWSLEYAGSLRYDATTGALRGTLRRNRGDGTSRSAWILTRQP